MQVILGLVLHDVARVLLLISMQVILVLHEVARLCIIINQYITN